MSYEHLEDEQLVSLIVQQDQRGLGALYDRYGKAVFGFVYHLLGDVGQTEEVVQEVFLRVWLRASSYRPERGRFQTWIMSMAHHRAVDELRKRRRLRDILETEARLTLMDSRAQEDTAAEWAEHREESEVVRKALESLPEEQRQVIQMSYYEGYSQSEIAELLQHPLGTVKTRMRLGMQKLKTALALLQEIT